MVSTSVVGWELIGKNRCGYVCPDIYNYWRQSLLFIPNLGRTTMTILFILIAYWIGCAVGFLVAKELKVKNV